ncbi:hypothetical protein CDAR_279041 [Caerostris darwini]|uniref:Uncharacterized protein n=1 Tax=Caerostris darwini TaxID=1538125 RepID=A0AAV4U946_9ARAC|nr:hypothetical protein CDAR_279041 [Caerostris darwini]
MGRYWGCKEDLHRNFSRSLKIFLATCGPALSWRSTIPLENLPLCLFMLVCLSLSNALQNYSALTVVPRCNQLMSRGASSSKMKQIIPFLAFWEE